MAEVVLELIQQQLDFLKTRIEDMERQSLERIRGVKEETARALLAADQAIHKAEIATDKRFDSVNEFRKTLSDQNSQFLRVDTYNTAHSSLMEKNEVIAQQVITLDAIIRSTPKPITGATFLIGVGSVVAAFVLALITGAIQLGAVQTHVEINTGLITQLQKFERDHSQFDGDQAVELGSIKARQNYNIERIQRLENRVNAFHELKQ